MVESSSIHHEQSSLLYNIAAVASHLGEAKWRASGEGATDDELREALSLFKLAVAAFRRISQEFPTATTQDLGPQPRGIFEALFRGQVMERGNCASTTATPFFFLVAPGAGGGAGQSHPHRGDRASGGGGGHPGCRML